MNTGQIETGSFEYWKNKGRRVHRGQKAAKFENGQALFTIWQTYAPQKANWNFSRSLGVSCESDEMPH